MRPSKPISSSLILLCALAVSAGGARGKDIGGTIASKLPITDDSQLVDDVICTVASAPCISFGSPGLTLELNGFRITGRGDSQTGCLGTSTAGEAGIFATGLKDLTIRGPDSVEQFRNYGIQLVNTTGSTIADVTVVTNCTSGIFLNGSANNIVERIVSIRNGHITSPCGGIGSASSNENRLRANRTIGNGFWAPGNNFGIGLIGTSSRNVVEDNSIFGNSNGIYLQPGAVGNVVRRNLAMDNPPIQIPASNPAGSGYDIWNLSPAGANTFHANVCLTSVNAPCPASAPPSLSASPHPIPAAGGAVSGMTTISWLAPGVEAVEVRIGSPDGVQFVGGGSRGSAQTGLWVGDGMTFYLQDISGGKPLNAENTLATVVVRLQRK